MLRPSNIPQKQDGKDSIPSSPYLYLQKSSIPTPSTIIPKSLLATPSIQVQKIHHTELGRVNYINSSSSSSTLTSREETVFTNMITESPFHLPGMDAKGFKLVKRTIPSKSWRRLGNNSAFQRVKPRWQDPVAQGSEAKPLTKDFSQNITNDGFDKSEDQKEKASGPSHKTGVEHSVKLTTVENLPKLENSIQPCEQISKLEKFPEVAKIFITEQVPKKSSRRANIKTTEYYYLLQRKTFRMMKKYYKEKFENFSSKYKFKRKVKEISREKWNDFFKEYVNQEQIFTFNAMKDNIEEGDKVTAIERIVSWGIIEPLQLLILWDRYRKLEKATEGMDFNASRSLLNHYNQKNLQQFLSSPANWLLTALYLKRACYVDSSNPTQHKDNEWLKQKDVDPQKLMKEMKFLYKSSLEKLPSNIDLSLN